MNRIMKSLAFVVMATLIGITAASAYVLLSPPRRWFSTPRNVTVDNRGLASVNDGNGGVSAAVNAVGAWGTQIVRGTAGTANYVLGDGISDLIFADPRNICKGSCIAATTTGYYDTNTTGTCDGLNVVAITDSDVAFNLSFNFTTTGENDGCASEIQLESVTTHEIGHLIGLGHSNQTSALMYASVAYCNNKQLSSDDRSGASALYCSNFVPGGGGGCNNNGTCDAGENCNTCSADCKSKTGGKPAGRYCCGNGVHEAAETTALCNGNF